jgi:hypothetical protein
VAGAVLLKKAAIGQVPDVKNALAINRPRELLRVPITVGRWIRREFMEVFPVVLFFLVGFLLVLLIVKLVLAQYAIAISALSRAILGALIAGKVVLVLDKTPLARSFRSYPRIATVLAKTIFYGLAVIVLGLADRIIHTWRHLGEFGAAIDEVVLKSDVHRLLAVALGVSMVFAVYFVLSELSEALGRDEIFALFFKRPAPHD